MNLTLNSSHELIILPSLEARQGDNGGFILTQKYLDGAAEYARAWPGPVTSLVDLTTDPGTDMDQVEAMPGTLETGLEARPQDKKALAARLEHAAVVLALLRPEEMATAALCHQINVPIVFIAEYTPKTETQIINETTPNLLRQIRRKVWIRNAERKRRLILQNYATGLQCSGTPSYDLYKSLSPNPMLFFDNRVRMADIIDDTFLTAKCDHLAKRVPLKLVFGGRITAMKGVLSLPRVAQALDRLKIPYQMDIFGSGDLEDALRQEISAGDLSNRVALHPPMDFRTGWIPLLKEKADLFVCCHPQGDPSSTYPEVMSCGVPIVGFANEALAGIIRESGAGQTVPIHDTEGLTKRIADLHNDRKELQKMSIRGRDFARRHCFEVTFSRRTTHLIEASRLPKPVQNPLGMKETSE